MISIEQISGEIAALEEEKPTHAVMQKLANLYTVRDHMVIDCTDKIKSVEVIPEMSLNSEFMQQIKGKDIYAVFKIVDELVTTVQIINPQLHASFMREVAAL